MIATLPRSLEADTYDSRDWFQLSGQLLMNGQVVVCKSKKQLATGICSNVWKIIDDNQKSWVVKVQVREDTRREMQGSEEIILVGAQNERDRLRVLYLLQKEKLENILWPVYIGGDQDVLGRFLMCPFVEAGDLFEFMANNYIKLSEDGRLVDVLSKLGEGMFSAVVWMHQNNYIHLDIKLENFLVAFGEGGVIPKLTDFEHTQCCSDDEEIELGMEIGTRGFFAPEIETSGRYSQKSDSFALGVSIYSMCTFSLPYLEDTRSHAVSNEIREKVKIKQAQWGPSFKLSKIIGIAKQLTALNDQERWSVQAAKNEFDRINARKKRSGNNMEGSRKRVRTDSVPC